MLFLILGRLSLTAHSFNKHWETIKITHPYHPLKNKKFTVLKKRIIGDAEFFHLKGTKTGSFCIPKEWTNQAEPELYKILDISPLILSYQKLTQLYSLINTLQQKKQERLAL